MNDPSLKFVEAAAAADLETVRRIAAVIWPETFKSILSQEQIIYMMQMMYAPIKILDKKYQTLLFANI